MNNTVETLKSTRGQFFTLVTKTGETMNAQLRGLTAKTAVVFDRNNNRCRRLNLKSIKGVRCGNRELAL